MLAKNKAIKHFCRDINFPFYTFANLQSLLIQTQLFQCHREERSDVAISLIHLKRLPRPFRARNDIVKIYIAFISDALSTISYF